MADNGFFQLHLALCPRVMPYLEPLFLSYCCCGHSACGKITLGKTNSLKRSKKLQNLKNSKQNKKSFLLVNFKWTWCAIFQQNDYRELQVRIMIDPKKHPKCEVRRPLHPGGRPSSSLLRGVKYCSIVVYTKLQ